MVCYRSCTAFVIISRVKLLSTPDRCYFQRRKNHYVIRVALPDTIFPLLSIAVISSPMWWARAAPPLLWPGHHQAPALGWNRLQWKGCWEVLTSITVFPSSFLKLSAYPRQDEMTFPLSTKLKRLLFIVRVSNRQNTLPPSTLVCSATNGCMFWHRCESLQGIFTFMVLRLIASAAKASSKDRVIHARSCRSYSLPENCTVSPAKLVKLQRCFEQTSC